MNEIEQLKVEVYDANKAIQKLNAILARVANIVKVDPGAGVSELFDELEALMASKKSEDKKEPAK